MFCMMFRVIMLFHSHAKVECRKQCENVCLDESHQQFKEPHEYAESNGYRRHCRTQHAFDIAENKDQAHETKDNDMPCRDVGKETDHEDERLGEYPEEIDKRHQRDREFKPPWHARCIIDMFPVIFVPDESRDNKSENCQNARDGQVAGHIRPEREERDQAHQVIKKDEEENSQQIRKIFFIFLFTDGGFGNVVPDKQDDWLNQGL